MRLRGVHVGAGLAGLLAGVLLLGFQTGSTAQQDRLEQARNLGKAFYENPTTQTQAVDQFKKALDMVPDSERERVNYGIALLHAAKTAEGIAELEKAQKQDPKIPHTWFNLGIAYKKDSKYDQAIAEFQGMVKLVPNEPISHYNLGVLYKLNGKTDDALKEFETSTRLNPRLAGPHFQLYNAYRTMSRAEDAAREQKTFNDIKKQQAGAAVPEDLEWSFYAEVYDITDPQNAKEADTAKPTRLAARKLADGFDAASAGVVTADIDGDGNPEVIAYSNSGIRIFKNGSTTPLDAGLNDIKDVISISPGDYNNDGLADLAILTKSGAQLWTNRKGKFEKLAVNLPEGAFNRAVWLDYDHDYDLDLFLLGDKSALIRNNGTAGFSDVSNSFPFVQGRALDGTLFDLTPDTDGMDLVVSYSDRPGVLYVDKLGGRYEAQDLDLIPAGAKTLAAMDLNNDGATDLVVAGEAAVFPIFNRRGSFEKGAAMAAKAGTFALADLENRGIEDIAVSGSVFRNEGLEKFSKNAAPVSEAAALTSVDFDADGRNDLIAVNSDGSLQFLRNETETSNGWLKAGLLGVKNLKLAYGSKIELKAGSHYQKRTYLGQPIVFGMRGYKEAETVRTAWANGLIQNEVHQAAGKAYTYKEAQRLSGSCPMIFTWDGKNFNFLTDVLGVAPLGASSGDGNYFPVDHDEYVQVPGEAMVPRDGKYELRITEELREVSYLDRIQLIAVDHPAATSIYTNDKFKSPPFPDFRLYGVTKPVHPKSARDDKGADVLPLLLKKDKKYPDSFSRDYTGVASLHHLDLDFGNAAAANRAVLVLSGWVDWADGSTFLAASQETKEGLILPYLQVKNAKGEWQTVIQDMGIPAGKPKTISVDLTGRFLSASREVRIVTNLCVYWDEIFLSEETGKPDTVLTPVDAQAADLHFRGFSKPVIHPERKQPENFLYGQVSTVSTWNPTSGNYTRYGDVRELLGSIDDRMVIMGAGDEVTLKFDAQSLPALKPGWKRDFLLMVDGWAKDADANTAFAKTVEPLPFHGMSAYPYPATEQYPGDAAHREYQEKYNVRPALRLLRPLD
ncbi:MAG TPA: FG-GAP-like repeat-containing protein [Bryobacteraceae bacterium]|nr:FG-GAP-like repeat-containing protein [Bryobacteraceae bacterium]